MSFDEQDAAYLRKLVEKTIAAHDGKFPAIQVSDRDLEPWEGVNVQGQSTAKPSENEDTIALYLIDVTDKKVKRFTITRTLLYFLSRNTSAIVYGTTNIANKHQFKILIQWEQEKRI